MGDGVFNYAKGKFVHWCTMPNVSDALIIVPIETSGLQADDTLNNHADLFALLNASNNEQTTMGRKTVTASITVTVDATNNWVDVDIPDQVWTSATGNPCSKLVICYDSDTGSGVDSAVLPLTYHDFVVTPDGSTITATIDTAGFGRAA